jgi:hypothetical protein
LKKSEEPKYNREQTVMEIDVHPYTSTGKISEHHSSKVSDVKTIKSMESEMKVISFI